MFTRKFSSNLQLRVGDWLVLALSLVAIVFMFQFFWVSTPAAKVQIRVGEKILGTYSLNQTRDIHVHGALGESVIRIHRGEARFLKSPCTGQYCVHQGWLKKAGQVALCLPNQISLELLGVTRDFDSLNY